MYATVGKIEEMIHAYADPAAAEEYDNVGALVGNREQKVSKILVALDATMDVVKEAQEIGAELIVTHHPLMFHARKNLLEEDAEGKILCEMVRARLSLIAAHTNLDKTFLSGSACCARLLELRNVRQEGYLFLGELPSPTTAEALKAAISGALNFPTRCYGLGSLSIRTLAIGGGACDEEWQEARTLGAQAFLTGEVRHHNALAASMEGFVLFDAGHYGTEAPLVPVLTEYLQNKLNDVQYHVTVYPSQRTPFGCV